MEYAKIERREKNLYKYDEDIKMEKIDECKSEGYRYYLTIPFKESIKNKWSNGKNYNTCEEFMKELSIDEKKRVMVIMKNPSTASKKESDRTTNNILNFCKCRFKEVQLVNMYPYRTEKVEELKKFFHKSDFDKKTEKNFEILEEKIKEVDSVIVAWGLFDDFNKDEQKKHDENYKKLTDILNRSGKSIRAMRFSEKDGPWHPRNWSKSFDLELYEWHS